MNKYGMVINLQTCFRSRTCMVGCKVLNRTPTVFDPESGGVEHYRIRPVEWEEGKYPNVRVISIPALCMHCDNPACIPACPEKAISKSPDGITVVDRDKCVGCGTCTEACPYGSPYIRDGKAERCDFCSDRLNDGLEPYCVENCPTKSLIFGNLNDPNSDVARLVASGKPKRLLPEAKTNPNVYYIAPNWYEDRWEKLSGNKSFLKAMAVRKKDILLPIKD